MKTITHLTALLVRSTFVLATLLIAPAAPGATRPVTKDTDNNPADAANAGELRYEINHAVSGDTVVFDAAYFSTPRTILLHTELYGSMAISSKSIAITGPGPESLAIDGGGLYDRVLTISSASVRLSGVTITNGVARGEGLGFPPLDMQFRGGGILALNGSLSLSNCWIVGNRASTALYSTGLGGRLCSFGGSLQMMRCVVSNNLAAAPYFSRGGGILISNASSILSNCVVVANTAGPSTAGSFASTALGGGVAVEAGSLQVMDCSISNNLAQAAAVPNSVAKGGGLYGGSPPPASMRFQRTTVAANAASGASALGGGLLLTNAISSALLNCTISGNALNGTSLVAGGGGIFGVCFLTNCTVASNSVATGSGGGLASSGPSITLKNTLVAANQAPAEADVVGAFLSFGHNLIGQTNAVPDFVKPGDQAGTVASPRDPLLGPLQDNGGLTATHALLAGSPAIDAGDNAGAPNTDQRGLPRPGGVTSTVDIGAYEAGIVGGPLTIRCGPPLNVATIGCAVTRTLFIPANLAPPTYAGGSGPATLRVKFAGEPADYPVPASLMFPMGVANLVWTVTAGAESASCTQPVTVIEGVNQAPEITPQPPVPTALAINSSKTVTLTVSDAETPNPSTLGVTSSSGSLLTLLTAGPDASGKYSVTITAGSAMGSETVTNIVVDACGASTTNTFTVQVNQAPAISDIPDQTVAKANVVGLTVPFRAAGSGNLTLGATHTLPPPVFIPPFGGVSMFVLSTAFAGEGNERSITESLGLPLPLPDWPAFFPAIVGVTVSVTDDNTLASNDAFAIRIVDAPDTDGIAAAVEDGAPNSGDGNADGTADRLQSEAASLPAAVEPPAYVTLAVANGLRLVDVQALTPPTPLPEGASFPQGLVQFRLEGLATLGAAVTVTQTFHGGLSSGLTFYKHGSAAPGAAVTYYPFMYDPPASPTGAEFILAENKIVLHLKDGALGDDDWTENGVILDAGGPALVSVEPVALSISQLTATTAEISWPASAGTLVLRYADSLASPVTWERDDHPAEVSGDRKRVTVELVGGTRFYSLGAP